MASPDFSEAIEGRSWSDGWEDFIDNAYGNVGVDTCSICVAAAEESERRRKRWFWQSWPGILGLHK